MAKQENPFLNIDFQKMMMDFKMPGIDADALMNAQQKNIEAISNANQLAAEGTAFRQSHALHLKLYTDGWGSGIYRRFESRKIGQVQISDYCPGSVDSW